MALFGSKKNTPAKKAAPKKEAKAVVAPSEKKTDAVMLDAKDVLLRPRVTEKAANMTAQGIYTFDVRKSATKKDVAAAVKKLYKVTVVKVTVVNTPAKRIPLKRKRGFGKTTASRKALVFLKKGEQIQFS
jgi:large subunit ribosomal protein L23